MACTGFEGSIGIRTARTDATLFASFTALKGARDASVTISADKADTSDRTSAFKAFVSAGLDVEISAELTYDTTVNDANLAAIRTACLDRTPILVGIFDNGIDPLLTTSGITFDAYVFSNDIAQPLAEGQTVSVTFAPASGQSNAPAWVVLGV